MTDICQESHIHLTYITDAKYISHAIVFNMKTYIKLLTVAGLAQIFLLSAPFVWICQETDNVSSGFCCLGRKILINTQDGTTTVEVLSDKSPQLPTFPPPSTFPTLPVPPVSEIKSYHPISTSTPSGRPQPPQATTTPPIKVKQRPIYRYTKPPIYHAVKALPTEISLPSLEPQFIRELPLPAIKNVSPE